MLTFTFRCSLVHGVTFNFLPILDFFFFFPKTVLTDITTLTPTEILIIVSKSTRQQATSTPPTRALGTATSCRSRRGRLLMWRFWILKQFNCSRTQGGGFGGTAERTLAWEPETNGEHIVLCAKTNRQGLKLLQKVKVGF